MIKMRFCLLSFDRVDFIFALRLIIIACFLGSVFNSNAQVTLLWPSKGKFQYYPNENASVRFYITENNNPGDLTIKKNNVQQLLHYTPNGRVVDIAAALTDTSVSSINLASLDEGTHMLIFHSKNTFQEIEAPVFNTFLQENICTDAINYRTLNKEDSMSGKENFQSSIKTIFQAGHSKSRICIQQTTLPLDIVPGKNVYDCKEGSTISKIFFTVYFKGKPLKNATVKIGHKLRDEELTSIVLKTDKKGRIKTGIKCNGLWRITVVQLQHLQAGSKAGWQCYSGSLTWGYN
ncbi:hypothetical protein BH10BAC3_BH10BAC3_34790 [soil metagenome]